MTDQLSSEPGVAGIAWTASIEHLLVKWCDEAKCFEWMQTESSTHDNIQYSYCGKWTLECDCWNSHCERLPTRMGLRISVDSRQHIKYVAGETAIPQIFKLTL